MAQNESERADLRVRRTRKMLKEALIDLCIERGFTKVTVQDIVDRAMINRATFYRHYLDKYDLLNEYMEEVYALTEPQQQHNTASDAPLGLVRMLEHVQTKRDFYRSMLGTRGDPAFAKHIKVYIEKRLRSMLESLSDTRSTPLLEMYLSSAAYSGVGAIMWWLEHGQAHSPETVAAWISLLTEAQLQAVLAQPT